MPKNIQVDTEPWCPKDCGHFCIGESNFYGNGTLLETYYYCENLPICRNAVNAHKEYEKKREEIASKLLEYCKAPEKEDK